MHIVLSGSMQFLAKMEQLAAELRAMGHTTTVPVMTPEEAGIHGVADGWNEADLDFANMTEAEIGKFKNLMLTFYFGKVRDGDALLVVNDTKRGIENHIGPNTFLEMGVAFAYGKPIYLLNPLPQQDHREELLGLQTVVIDGDLTRITQALAA